MSIEDIIRTWKSGEEVLDLYLPANPVGRELAEQELLEILGGDCSGGRQGTCWTSLDCGPADQGDCPKYTLTG